MKLSGVLGLCLRVLGSTGLDTRMQHGEEMPAECQPLLDHILVFWFAVGGKDLSFFRAMQADHEVARMPLPCQVDVDLLSAASHIAGREQVILDARTSPCGFSSSSSMLDLLHGHDMNVQQRKLSSS